MLLEVVQTAARHVARSHPSGLMAVLRHFGIFGLFALAVVDGSPVPTFAGPDILTAVLAASHRGPWYEYAAVATAGSVIGLWLAFRLARKAGMAYLHNKFGHSRVERLLSSFERWGTGLLAASIAIPLPSPTSMLAAAAGASRYSVRKYIALVAVCRAARYCVIAFVASYYGRHFIRILRHPGQYWQWSLLCAGVLLAAIAAGMFVSSRLQRLTAET